MFSLTNKQFQSFVYSAVGLQFIAAAQFIYSPNEPIERGLAFGIGGLLVLMGIGAWAKGKLKAKTFWDTLHYIAMALMLIHALIQAWYHTPDFLHAINLIIISNLIARMGGIQQSRQSNQGNIAGVITFILCVVFAVFRADDAEHEELLESTLNLPFIALSTLEALALHGWLQYRVDSKLIQNETELNSRIKFQSDIINIISHNIRTPLSHIYSRMELERLREEHPPKLLEDIAPSVEHIVRIVDKTLSNKRALVGDRVERTIESIALDVQESFGARAKVSYEQSVSGIPIKDSAPLTYALKIMLSCAERWTLNGVPSVRIEGESGKVHLTVVARGKGMGHDELTLFGNPNLVNSPSSEQQSEENAMGMDTFLAIGTLASLGYDILLKTKPDWGVIAYVAESRENIYQKYLEEGYCYKFFPALDTQHPVVKDLR